MDQVLPLDMVRELALHRLGNAQEDVEELLAGGVPLDDLAESGILGNWTSSEEKVQANQERKAEQTAFLQALTESCSAGESGCEEF